MEKTYPSGVEESPPLPAESTLARVGIRKKLIPLLKPTALAHALIKIVSF